MRFTLPTPCPLCPRPLMVTVCATDDTAALTAVVSDVLAECLGCGTLWTEKDADALVTPEAVSAALAEWRQTATDRDGGLRR